MQCHTTSTFTDDKIVNEIQELTDIVSPFKTQSFTPFIPNFNQVYRAPVTEQDKASESLESAAQHPGKIKKIAKAIGIPITSVSSLAAALQFSKGVIDAMDDLGEQRGMPYPMPLVLLLAIITAFTCYLTSFSLNYRSGTESIEELYQLLQDLYSNEPNDEPSQYSKLTKVLAATTGAIISLLTAIGSFGLSYGGIKEFLSLLFMTLGIPLAGLPFYVDVILFLINAYICSNDFLSSLGTEGKHTVEELLGFFDKSETKLLELGNLLKNLIYKTPHLPAEIKNLFTKFDNDIDNKEQLVNKLKGFLKKIPHLLAKTGKLSLVVFFTGVLPIVLALLSANAVAAEYYYGASYLVELFGDLFAMIGADRDKANPLSYLHYLIFLSSLISNYALYGRYVVQGFLKLERWVFRLASQGLYEVKYLSLSCYGILAGRNVGYDYNGVFKDLHWPSKEGIIDFGVKTIMYLPKAIVYLPMMLIILVQAIASACLTKAGLKDMKEVGEWFNSFFSCIPVISWENFSTLEAGIDFCATVGTEGGAFKDQTDETIFKVEKKQEEPSITTLIRDNMSYYLAQQGLFKPRLVNSSKEDLELGMPFDASSHPTYGSET